MDSRRTRRAVSDVISFALVFSLIASTVAVVYVSGFAGLQDTRDAEQFDNAERAFDVLADNVQDLYQDGAPSRATEVKLGGSTMSYGEPTTVTVEVTNVGNSPTQSVSLEPIVFSPSGQESELVYEAGAVVRSERGGSVFSDGPPFMFVEDDSGSTRTALLPLVQTRSEGSAAVGGQSTILVRTELAVSESLGTWTDADTEGADLDGDGENEYDVTLTIQTSPERAALWQGYLAEEIPGSTCSLTDGDGDGADEMVECTFAVEKLYVSAARIDVAYE